MRQLCNHTIHPADQTHNVFCSTHECWRNTQWDANKWVVG